MSLNIDQEESKACVKPHTLTLDDCLACSSCISTSEQSTLMKKTDINLLKEKAYFIISPHAKINVFNNFYKKHSTKLGDTSQEKFIIFEDMLCIFLMDLFQSEIQDISHFYSNIYEESYKMLKKNKMVISSSCPGTVVYIERKAHHLLDNLLKIKTPQQICASTLKRDKKIVSVATCYDKKLENSNYFDFIISSIEFNLFLEENKFIDYLLEQKHYVSLEKRIKTLFHRSIQIDENYIEYFIMKLETEDVESKKINKDFYEINVKKNEDNYKFARIYGLENILNFINKSKKIINYDFVEAFICSSSCINGPTQIKGTLIADIAFKENYKMKNEIYKKTELGDISRNFSKIQQKKKVFQVEW